MKRWRLPWWINPWREARRLRALAEQPQRERRARDRRRRSRIVHADLARFGKGVG